MRVLITGGAGFIGSHLVQHCEPLSDVIVIDNFRTGSIENLRGRKCRLIDDTIENGDRLRRACNEVDIIFHLAAVSGVADSLRNPSECLRTNIVGTLNVLRAAVAAGVKRVVLASSASVYSLEALPACTFGTPRFWANPYAVSKRSGERACERAFRSHKLSVVCLRYFNVYGRRQRNGAVIPVFFDRARRNLPLSVHGDGMQTRDFVHVDDVVRATMIAASCAQSGVYDVGTGTSLSIRNVACRIIDLTASSSKIVWRRARCEDVRQSCANAGRLAAYGFQSKVRIDDGLNEMAHGDSPAPVVKS
jgi:UDP-glucose 4-epimerase